MGSAHFPRHAGRGTVAAPVKITLLRSCAGFMQHKLRILHLEDDPDYAELVRAMLENGGFEANLLWVSSRADAVFPFGTLVINVSGSFVLGLLFAWAIERDVLPADIRGPLMIGFIGAYTTFSTLMLESWAVSYTHLRAHETGRNVGLGGVVL